MVAPRSVEKGRGGAPSTRVKILLQALVRTVVKQPMKSMGDAKIHSQPVGGVLTLKQVDTRESCVRREWRERALASQLEQPILRGLHPMHKRPTSQQFWEDCLPVVWTHVAAVLARLLLMRLEPR